MFLVKEGVGGIKVCQGRDNIVGKEATEMDTAVLTWMPNGVMMAEKETQ